jgi:hypothetical protein
MVDGVIWMPSRARGLAVPQHLAVSGGDLVTIGPADELAVADDDTGASQ